MRLLYLSIFVAVLMAGCRPGLDIWEATWSGDIEAVKWQLNAGSDVNGKDSLERTPLYYSALEGFKEITELLIAKGADVNAKTQTGRTPLHYAARGGHKEIIEILISNGAHLNAMVVDGETSLDWVKKAYDWETSEVKAEKKEIATLLRKHNGKMGVDFSIHIAARKGNIKAVKQHLSDGFNAKDELGSTPLSQAAIAGNYEIVDLLVANGADVNTKDYRGSSPLHLAAQYGHKEIIEILISNGAYVNAMVVDGETSLDWVEKVYDWDSSKIKAEKKEIANLLRKHGGKMGVEISIQIAARKGNIEAVKRQLEAGTDVNGKGAEGLPPLRIATIEGHHKIAESLIAKGADVNATINGLNSLHLAAQYGHKEIIELLISNGAHVNATVVDSETSLDWTEKTSEWKSREIKADKKETTNVLRKRGGKMNEKFPIHLAAREGDIKAVKQHLENGTDVNAKNELGRTPLSQAAIGGHYEVIKMLIAEGAFWKANPVSLTGNTPLGFACQHNHPEIAKFLITNGANLNANDFSGGTPLGLAARFGHKEIAELLIAKGANVDGRDKYGRTPLHRAAMYAGQRRKRDGTIYPSQGGLKEVIELLIIKGADVNAIFVSGRNQGKTPLDRAKQQKQPEILNLLRKHGGKTKKELGG